MSYFKAITQNVTADLNNSATNAATGAGYGTHNFNLATPTWAFTGTASSTLGVAGIQVSLFADKNCTVKVEQSADGTNWDLSDSYNYYASGNFGITVQAVSSYVRVLVTSASLTTTIFRLQTALCPIVEAVPRALDSEGHMKVAVKSTEDEYGWSVENTPMGDMRVAEPVRLVGASFDLAGNGGVPDFNFWTAGKSATTGTVLSQAVGEVTLDAGSDNGGYARMCSVRRGRYVGGTSMRYRSVIAVAAGQANNTRDWGIGYGTTAHATYAMTDGAWFRMNGTTFELVTKRNNSEATPITSFNGTLGSTWSPGTGAHTYEIYWTNRSVWFAVDDELLHKASFDSDTWAGTMSPYIIHNCVNSGASASATMKVRVASISRMGKQETLPQYFHGTTAAATTVKYGSGTLHRVVLNDTKAGTLITLADATSGTTPAIAVLGNFTANGQMTLHFNCPFFNGLTITSTGTWDFTVIYE